MSDTEGFRRVLHEWARRQVEAHGHVGPVDILGVRAWYERGHGSWNTPADDEVAVTIDFRHPGGCPGWSRPEWPCQPQNVWSMTIDMTGVRLLNELLVIGDGSGM